MNSLLDAIDFKSSETLNMLSINIPQIKSMISEGHTAIIVLVSIAILMGIAILIRQQKILRKLDELTKKTEEPTTEDKP